MITIETTSGRGDFILHENHEPVLNLKRTNWFSSTAETTYLGNFLQIKSSNIWNTTFDITENIHVVGHIKFNWRGGVHIDIMGQNYKKHVFFLQKKGFLTTQYKLYTANDQHVLTISPHFNWSSFGYNYTIKEEGVLADDIDIYELIMYCVYSATMYRKKRSSG